MNGWISRRHIEVKIDFVGHNCIANSVWYFVKQTLFFGHQVRIVHFDIWNFLVSLQNKKTSENKRVNNLTWFDTHLGI